MAPPHGRRTNHGKIGLPPCYTIFAVLDLRIVTNYDALIPDMV